jgi:hypothetical protein
MNTILISIIVGCIAGIIDIVPMIIQKLDRYAIISAFIHWVVASLVIFHINFNINPLLKGFILSLILALPVMVLIFKESPKSILPIFIMTTILGLAVGFASSKF